MMIINTKEHMSDSAKTFTIKSNKNNPINDVQEFLEKFTKISINGNSNATTNSEGLVLLYSGKNDNSVVSTKDFLKKAVSINATESIVGVSKFVDLRNYKNSDVNHIIDPKTMNDYLDNVRATISTHGLAKFATETELNSRKGDSLITPKNIKSFMDKFVPKQETATESITGLVKVVNFNSLYGTGKDFHEGYAITPKTFMQSTATDTRLGIARFINNYDSKTNKDTDVVTPKSIFGLKKKIDDGNAILNRLDKSIVSDDKKYNSDVTRIVEELIEGRRREIFNEIMPIGQIIITSSASNTKRIKTLDGQYLNKDTYSELFSIIGYKYGRRGDDFRLPDTRGLFLKATGKGNLINGPLGDITSFELGSFVQQGIAPHKHASFSFRLSELSDPKYKDHKHGLWGTGSTKNRNFYGAGYVDRGGYFAWEPRPTPSVVISQTKKLRYTDKGNMRGNNYGTSHNGESRPWNISLNYAIRAL